MNELLGQGLVMTAVGMGLVFAALALVWALIAGLARLFPARTEAGDAGRTRKPVLAGTDEIGPVFETAEAGAGPQVRSEAEADVALTAERAQVAAIVAGALMANALPKLLGVPSVQTFEDGRSAPSWVTTNRAQAMRTWQPPRQEAEG